MKKWEAYEAAAKQVIGDLRVKLGVIKVGGKQKIAGIDGTTYELDAVAWTDASGSFLLVEARRHTSSRLDQDAVNAIAYKLYKVGAEGAIILSPLPLQAGAKKVADFDHIEHILLSADSTAEDYLAEYLGQHFLGASIVESTTAGDACDATVIKAASVKPSNA